MDVVTAEPHVVELACSVNGEFTLAPLVGVTTLMADVVREVLAGLAMTVVEQPEHTSARMAASRIFIKSASNPIEQARSNVACFIAKNRRGES